MFDIDNKTKAIKLTRGDICTFDLCIKDKNSKYVFLQGDVVRFKVLKSQDCGCVIMQKDVTATAGETSVSFDLTSEDTRIGELINKPVTYWYEIELNPETSPQTVIGYDDDGAKMFILYPEGSEEQ